MKLTVPTPPGWLRQQLVSGELLKAPSRDLSMIVMPIEGAKLEPLKWLWSALVHADERSSSVYDLDEDPDPSKFVTGQIKTIGSWTALTVEGKVGTESRLVAYYTFLDLSATVIVRCTDGDVAEWKDEVIAILYRAMPDFSQDRPTCLAEILGAKPPLLRAPVTLPPHTWRRASSGGDAVLIARLDPDAGWIRISAGLTPQRNFPEMFAELEDAWPELGITDEGEYFAVAHAQRGRMLRSLAFVLGAETYMRIEGQCVSPDQFDAFALAVRAVAYQSALGYGARRARPFYYVPPAEWGALVRSGSTTWVSPVCARAYHVLRVFDACPPEQEATLRRRRFESIAPEFMVTPPRGPAVYYRADEREVRVWSYTGALAGGEIRILEATVVDAAYCYPIRITCDPRLFDESMRLLEEVVETIVPLPAPPAEPQVSKASIEVFSEWAE